MSRTLTREQLEGLTFATRKVQVPGGDHVYIREITAEQVLALGKLSSDERASIDLVALSLIERKPEGDGWRPMYTDIADARVALKRVPGAVLERLIKAALRLNELETSIERAVGNSERIPDESPATDSL